MAKAWAVLVGVLHMENGTWGSGSENSEEDVDQMQGILSGFDNVVPLKTAGATRDAVLNAVGAAAAALEKGDIFVFYYAGHGLADKDRFIRHLLVLYNEFLETSELGKIWCSFRPGVRIVMISESCNSGTDYMRYLIEIGWLSAKIGKVEGSHRVRKVGRVGRSSLGPLLPFKDDTQASGMQAEMIHFGATADDERAVGGEFTAELINVWKQNSFGTYREFFCQILTRVKNSRFGEFQFPEYRPYGLVGVDFESQRPFTIEPPQSTNEGVTVKAIVSVRDCKSVARKLG